MPSYITVNLKSNKRVEDDTIKEIRVLVFESAKLEEH